MQQPLTIRYWGVRGSTPTSGPATCRYGGNTSCVSVEQEDRVLVLDAGTGIRLLGEHVAGDGRDVFVLVSHPHLDHVQGFPFFEPLYEAGRTVYVADFRWGGFTWSPMALLDGVLVPMRPDDLQARVVRIRDAEGFLPSRGFDLELLPMAHPGGAYGFRLRHGGRTFVHIPDNELSRTTPEARERLVAFCRGADVLSHDAQYVPDDMPLKSGWGHSLVERVRALAVDAGVKHLVLFHHDPNRDDDALDRLQAESRERLEPHGIRCTAAYEGLSLVLEPADQPAHVPSSA